MARPDNATQCVALHRTLDFGRGEGFGTYDLLFGSLTLRGTTRASRLIRSLFHPEALADYLAAVRDPAVVHAMCEDYRAGATVYHELDEADLAAGRRIHCPVLALWAGQDELGRWFDVLETWRRWADDGGRRARPRDESVQAVLTVLFRWVPEGSDPIERTRMPELTTPRDLFLHELGDILYVERALAKETLPKLIGEVSDEEFKSGLESHLEQTRQHVANVEKVFELLGEEPEVEKCVGFEGLKKEHDQLIEESASSLVDIVDVGAAARTENYEIAAYEGLRRMAKAMGENEAVELLDKNLTQEKETLREVEKIATRLSNDSAKEASAA